MLGVGNPFKDAFDSLLKVILILEDAILEETLKENTAFTSKNLYQLFILILLAQLDANVSPETVSELSHLFLTRRLNFSKLLRFKDLQ